MINLPSILEVKTNSFILIFFVIRIYNELCHKSNVVLEEYWCGQTSIPPAQALSGDQNQFLSMYRHLIAICVGM